MGRAIWRVIEKQKLPIFAPGPAPLWPHGEAGLDGSGVLSYFGSLPGAAGGTVGPRFELELT